MIIITLFLSCLLIIATYWNSYNNLLKRLKGPESRPAEYNVIILAGNSASASQDLLDLLKEELLKNSIDLGMIYDAVRKSHNIDIPIYYTNSISNNSITPSVQIPPKLHPENNGRVSGLYQGKRVYAVIQKCVGNECEFANLTFSSEEPQKPPKITKPVIVSRLKLTKVKPSPTLPLKKNSKKKSEPLKINVLKNETTTILKYTKSLGVYESLLNFFWVFLSFVNAQYTLPIIAIAMPAISVLINFYRWQKTKQTYEDPRRVRNVPDIQEILTKIVKNLHKISTEQEKLYRLEKINACFKLVNDMNQRVKMMEDDLLKKQLKIEEDMIVLINKNSADMLRTLNTVHNKEAECRQAIKEERTHLLLLYELESILLIESVFKLCAADIQFDHFINVLETTLSRLDHNEKIKLLIIRDKIDALKRDRDNLLNLFENSSLLKLITGNRELTDHVPRRFLISTNQNEVSS